RLEARKNVVDATRRSWQQVEERRRYRVEALLRNYVAWKRLTGLRVNRDRLSRVIRIDQLVQITVALSIARYLSEAGDCLPLAKTFVAAEEEGPVSDDRSADRRAKLILLEWRNGLCRAVEEILGVQCLVSQELIGGSMKAIAP